MKRLTLLIIFIFFNVIVTKGQERTEFKAGFDKRISIFTGYNYIGKDDEKRSFHSLELGISKTAFTFGSPHPGGRGWYISSEFLLDKDLFITPKIGCFLYYVAFVIGIDLGYQTNMTEGSLAITPYFGMGNQKIQILLKPNIRITNRNFQDFNVINLTCYYHFLPLKKSFTPYKPYK